MRRKVLVGLLWLAAITGALPTAVFVLMLLMPGYGDAVIVVCAGLSAAIALGAAVPLWRRRTAAAAARPTVGGAELELLPPGRIDPILGGLLSAAGVLGVIWLQFLGGVNGRRTTAAAGPTVGGAELELLPPGRLSSILGGLCCAPGVAGAIWLLLLGGVNGWGLLMGLGCGTGLLANALQLVPGVSYVLIMTEGLVIQEFGRVRTYSWQGIDNFRVLKVSTPHGYLLSVGWDTCDDAPPGVMRSKPSRRLSGVASMSDTYGDADELAQRLQRYRDQYAGRRPQGEDGRGKRDPAKTPPA